MHNRSNHGQLGKLLKRFKVILETSALDAMRLLLVFLYMSVSLPLYLY